MFVQRSGSPFTGRTCHTCLAKVGFISAKSFHNITLVILGEIVHIKLKPYNSYCVEKIWIGFTKGNNKEGSLDQTQRAEMKQMLDNKGITGSGFDQLVKGQYQPRMFIPIASQEVAGQIVSLHEDQSGVAARCVFRSWFKCL